MSHEGDALVCRSWGVDSTTVLPAPLSVTLMRLAVPVSTRSSVRVALVVRVT